MHRSRPKSLANEYKRAVKRYNSEEKLTDKTLYDLCRLHPKHKNKSDIHAKLWIIGRTYATGIERKIEATGQQGGSMRQVAKHLHEHARSLDAMFSRLRRIKKPLTEGKLKRIIETHNDFLNILGELHDLKKKPPRSFASKYMHFHCPFVPIFDTFAVKGLRKLGLLKSVGPSALPHADTKYAKYVSGFWALYQEAEKVGLRPTVKLLDRYLLLIAENRRAKRQHHPR